MTGHEHPAPDGPDVREWSWAGPPSLEVRATPMILPDGRRQTWHLVEAQGGAAGAVCIAHRDGEIVLGRAWRLPLGGESLELPRGFGEPGEDPVTAALRELREETGLDGAEGVELGSVYPDTGLLANRVVVVLCTVAAPGSAGDGELGSWDWYRIGAVDELVASGRVVDGITLAALALWRSRRG